MADGLKVGDRVRLKGAEPVGVVESIGDVVNVRYPHPGRTSLGIYPETHLELLPPEPAADEIPTHEDGEPEKTFEGSPSTKPKRKG
jgi:hypothetical protein